MRSDNIGENCADAHRRCIGTLDKKTAQEIRRERSLFPVEFVKTQSGEFDARIAAAFNSFEIAAVFQ